MYAIGKAGITIGNSATKEYPMAAPGLGLYDKYFQSSFSSGIQSSNFILNLVDF